MDRLARHEKGAIVGYRVLRAVVRSILRVMFGLLGGVRVEGAGAVPSDGGVILAPNHVSHADPPLIGVVVDRPLWFIATDELFAIPLAGALAAALHAFAIRQDAPDRQALRRAEELLRRGEALVAFPEGHESLDGRLQLLQGGVVLLALRTGVPVLPVVISGTDRMLPAREWLPRHAGAPMVVRFGTPIVPDRLSGGLHGKAAIAHGREVLRSELLRLGAVPSDDAPSEKESEGRMA